MCVRCVGVTLVRACMSLNITHSLARTHSLKNNLCACTYKHNTDLCVSDIRLQRVETIHVGRLHGPRALWYPSPHEVFACSHRLQENRTRSRIMPIRHLINWFRVIRFAKSNPFCFTFADAGARAMQVVLCTIHVPVKRNVKYM